MNIRYQEQKKSTTTNWATISVVIIAERKTIIKRIADYNQRHRIRLNLHLKEESVINQTKLT